MTLSDAITEKELRTMQDTVPSYNPVIADEISGAMDTLEGCTIHECHHPESYCTHCTDCKRCSVKLRRDLCTR